MGFLKILYAAPLLFLLFYRLRPTAGMRTGSNLILLHCQALRLQ